jgi:tetratricopeptide (TPR) repeat protein
LTSVVRHLYTNLENDQQGNLVLEAMAQPLQTLEDDATAINLATEIEQWLTGRAYYDQGEFEDAKTALGIAIGLNSANPGTHFDRGLAYAALDQPDQALTDFETALSLDQGQSGRVHQAIMSDSQLYTALWRNTEAHPLLAEAVPTPTGSP